MIEFPVAISSHSKCFICKNILKSTKLHSVSHNTVKRAFKDFKIILKPNSRCCGRHIDHNKNLKEEEYRNIRTNIKSIKKRDLIIFKKALDKKDACCIFDKFGDFDKLDDQLCIQVTGWNKEQFKRFSLFINNVNETKKRGLYELIAIYRFWLRKGAGQLTLSFLKSESTQQIISHYLDHIRMAIYKEFTPYFLGADKNREFYLQHNNLTTTTLHRMEKDVLAVIADGTYTRLEKSNNNNFQYQTYSVQKLDNLIKPFVMSCADGWIIDVYGPFSAADNDAKILNYIMSTDGDLMRILEPKKTLIFLDRGIYSDYLVPYLIKHLNYNIT